MSKWCMLLLLITSCSAPGSGYFADAGLDVEVDEGAVEDQSVPQDAGFDLGVANYGGSGCTGECCPASLCQPAPSPTPSPIPQPNFQ